MSNAKMGWNSQFMIGFFKKEASYNAGVTMDAANACSLTGTKNESAKWPDKIENDKDEVSNKEHGYDQEIIEKGVEISVSIDRAKPNDLIGIIALGLGNVVDTQDAALPAYSHKITPIAAGTDLPSTQVEEKRGNVQQYAYRGVKCDNFKIGVEMGGIVSIEALLVGSGYREESAAAFAASITESWLKCSQMKAWLETGSDITINTALVQDTQDISGAVPDDIKAELKSAEISWNNNLFRGQGFGGDGELQYLDYQRRVCELKYTMLFKDKTHLDNYLSQEVYALEFDLKGALIAATGAMYFGVQVIVPRFKLKEMPGPKGGAGDLIEAEFVCEVFEDGTNPPLIIEGYNVPAAYLAA